MGSEAANTDVKWFEEERDQFDVESAMVVVEGGDSLLRVPTSTQLKIGKTQSMIDKHVIDEMWEFLYKIISGKQQVTKQAAMGPVLGADPSEEGEKVRQILPTKPKPVLRKKYALKISNYFSFSNFTERSFDAEYKRL